MDTLRAREWLSVTFTAPRIRRQVEVYVDSEEGIDVWLMPASSIGDFENDDDFDYYTSRRRFREGTIRFTPDPGEKWALVLDNPRGGAVRVHHDVRW